jgi:hypothetical protein
VYVVLIVYRVYVFVSVCMRSARLHQSAAARYGAPKIVCIEYIGVFSVYIQHNYVYYCDTCYVPQVEDALAPGPAEFALTRSRGPLAGAEEAHRLQGLLACFEGTIERPGSSEVLVLLYRRRMSICVYMQYNCV